MRVRACKIEGEVGQVREVEEVSGDLLFIGFCVGSSLCRIDRLDREIKT